MADINTAMINAPWWYRNIEDKYPDALMQGMAVGVRMAQQKQEQAFNLAQLGMAQQRLELDAQVMQARLANENLQLKMAQEDVAQQPYAADVMSQWRRGNYDYWNDNIKSPRLISQLTTVQANLKSSDLVLKDRNQYVADVNTLGGAERRWVINAFQENGIPWPPPPNMTLPDNLYQVLNDAKESNQARLETYELQKIKAKAAAPIEATINAANGGIEIPAIPIVDKKTGAVEGKATISSSGGLHVMTPAKSTEPTPYQNQQMIRTQINTERDLLKLADADGDEAAKAKHKAEIERLEKLLESTRTGTTSKTKLVWDENTNNFK